MNSRAHLPLLQAHTMLDVRLLGGCRRMAGTDGTCGLMLL